jgi:raffinose/stachyose/melibiose transport system permease protein
MTKTISSIKRSKRHQIIYELIGILVSFIILVPFLLVIVNSMKNKRQANMLQLNFKGISLNQLVENYTTVFKEARIVSSFLNSAIVTAGGAILVLFFASMAAFVIVRRKTKVSRFINNFIIMGLTLPISMVPIYFELSKLKMTTGNAAIFGAILVYTASTFPFTFFLYTGFIKGISSEIDEAAIVDGASPLKMFFRIIFPLLKPVTVTALMNCVMTIWNDFGISLYLLNNSKRTTAVLTTYLFLGQKASEWHLLFADVVIVALPVVIVYLAIQKHIVAGLSDGAVKG